MLSPLACKSLVHLLAPPKRDRDLLASAPRPAYIELLPPELLIRILELLHDPHSSSSTTSR